MYFPWSLPGHLSAILDWNRNMAQLYTISAFTEDTPGVLHRLTVLFTRRKVNIESLTVSHTERPGISRFTIVVHSDLDMVLKIAKQINRVIEVFDVFVAENRDLVSKEIAFLKISADSATKRMQVEELANRYGASVAYAHSDYLIIEKTGTEDEINSLYLLLEPFGMKEFLRSGRIATLKEERTDRRILVGD